MDPNNPSTGYTETLAVADALSWVLGYTGDDELLEYLQDYSEVGDGTNDQ